MFLNPTALHSLSAREGVNVPWAERVLKVPAMVSGTGAPSPAAWTPTAQLPAVHAHEPQCPHHFLQSPFPGQQNRTVLPEEFPCACQSSLSGPAAIAAPPGFVPWLPLYPIPATM